MPETTARALFTRRQALGLIGAAGAASYVALARGGRAQAATCSVTPAETEGPYWVDEGLERSDITVDPSDGSVKPGVPLTLTITVLRADAACVPAPGIRVDVWHCDAGGLYSDESANGTVGMKFLRGYQTTDDSGVVRFATIYPGWYMGRTIHVHFRIRAFDGATTTTNFTSQLFFDDTVSDQVLARAPYNTRGSRDTTNANDTIYRAATLLALTDDGSGGYVGTFDVALDGLPAGGGGTCADRSTCAAAVTAALPDPATAADKKSRRVARRLIRLNNHVSTVLGRAASSTGARQTKLYRRARTLLGKLLSVATAADAAGTLGASLASLEATVNALLALIPAA
jgi:protocatechuate 3,4-dioxygenase beta subunit